MAETKGKPKKSGMFARVLAAVMMKPHGADSNFSAVAVAPHGYAKTIWRGGSAARRAKIRRKNVARHKGH